VEEGQSNWNDITQPYPIGKQGSDFIESNDIPTSSLSSMQLSMLSMLDNEKIFKSVVEAIPVEMMNVLSNQEGFTDNVFSNQSLAELGFIVVRVDGLGTSGRSKEFHNHSYKNMGNNLEDHVLAIKYLAKTYSWIDIDKVGIYGHSAGGYDTGRALLVFPDFYKVGVASSADHDFRMEKAWWPEMYQGWPIDKTYQEVSNVTNASNLKGKLLLTHGGLDDNVKKIQRSNFMALPAATDEIVTAVIE